MKRFHFNSKFRKVTKIHPTSPISKLSPIGKKLKKDSQVNQDNIIADKVSQYSKPPQLTDKKPSEASNSVIKESNITVTKNGTKSAHVRFVGPVPDSMAAFPPEKAKVLQ
ncbi:hypothetical protein AVEN_114575-1, partial [Araneus ventricosus]